MNIRPYKESDFDEIVRIIEAAQIIDCWPKVFPEGWSGERIRDEITPKNPKYPIRNLVFNVAEINGGARGFIIGQDLASFIKNEAPQLSEEFSRRGLLSPEIFDSSFYQRDLIIHPDNQKGLTGLRLFQTLKKYATSNGFAKLVTRTPPQNKRGMQFFKGLGYYDLFKDNNPKRKYFVMDLRRK